MATAPKILIVDDDEDDFILTRDLLQEAYGSGITVDWAESWADGLDAISAKNHDVYLIDYHLGARDGLQLVREANDLECRAPIILLTGQDDRETDIQAMEAGANDYLVKDLITADQLARAIRYGINQKNVEKRLVEMAQYDSLTGLANRSLFGDRLEYSIAQSRRLELHVAVFLMDLDRFKEVNDTLGHPVGDALLKGVANRLSDCVRETDTVARLSGDEFAIIATNLKTSHGATKLADKIVEAFRAPFKLDGRDVYANISMGICVLDKDQPRASLLLKNADLALYQAKTERGSTFRYFDQTMNAEEQAYRSMEREIRLALERDEFELHFQPKVNLGTGELAGVEALLRWNHSELGAVPPSDIIPIAEGSGLIQPLGAWVLRKAGFQIKEWQRLGLPAIPIAVNTSALQFKRMGLYDDVKQTLFDSGISPSLLELEITESVAMDRSGVAMDVIKQLCDIGVRITIDDFGTDYATFRLLTDVPVRGVKVDRSFVNKMSGDRKHAAIVKTIISMGHNLGLSVVAEGVETESELQMLRDQGCIEAQGWYFSAALSGEEFVEWYWKTVQPQQALAISAE